MSSCLSLSLCDAESENSVLLFHLCCKVLIYIVSITPFCIAFNVDTVRTQWGGHTS